MIEEGWLINIFIKQQINNMSAKNKKQFGIWLDGQQATIVGRDGIETGNFKVLAHEKNKSQGSNSNENASTLILLVVCRSFILLIHYRLFIWSGASGLKLPGDSS